MGRKRRSKRKHRGDGVRSVVPTSDATSVVTPRSEVVLSHVARTTAATIAPDVPACVDPDPLLSVTAEPMHPGQDGRKRPSTTPLSEAAAEPLNERNVTNASTITVEARTSGLPLPISDRPVRHAAASAANLPRSDSQLFLDLGSSASVHRSDSPVNLAAAAKSPLPRSDSSLFLDAASAVSMSRSGSPDALAVDLKAPLPTSGCQPLMDGASAAILPLKDPPVGLALVSAKSPTRSGSPVGLAMVPKASIPSSESPVPAVEVKVSSPARANAGHYIAPNSQPASATVIGENASAQQAGQRELAESPALATFSKTYTMFGVTAVRRSETAYDTDLIVRSGLPSGQDCRIKRTGAPSPDVADDVRRRMGVAFAWFACICAHTYAAWIAIRSWVLQETIAPISGDTCNHLFLVSAMLVSVSLLTGATIMRGSRVWATAIDGMDAAVDYVTAAVKVLAFLKPLFWMVCFCLLANLTTMRSSAALEGPSCAVGQLALVAVCCLFSRHPTRISWRTVLSALLAHHLLALVLVYHGAGRSPLVCFSHLVSRATSFSHEGGRLVLGGLVTGGFEQISFFVVPGFAFSVLPNVLFLGFLANLLFHYGLAQRVIANVGWLAHHALGVTCCEAVVALANIFLGMSEAPLLIRPYVERLTSSELHCVMTVGFATMSAAVLPTDAELGIDSVDLIVASLLSTIAGIASSKLLYPEIKLSITAHYNIDEYESPEKSAVEAVVGGMETVAAMAPAIACSLFTFLSAEACVHELCSHLGKLVLIPELTPHAMLTMLFEPMAVLMGIELSEVHCAARLLSTGVLANEIVAYRDLVQQPCSASLSVRTRRLMTYALCSFANVGSTAVTMGALSAIAPSRSADVASLIFRALVAGCIADLITACTVGTMITNKSNPAVAKFNATDFLHG